MAERALALMVGAVLIACLVLAAHTVPTAVTAEDRVYVGRMLRASGHQPDEIASSAHRTFEDQVRAIRAVQDAVIDASPEWKRIPEGKPREPKDLYEAGRALCFDRARSIAKGLRMLGFQTRQVFLLATDEHPFLLAAILPSSDQRAASDWLPRARSHAALEVRTWRGWMYVDVYRWVALTMDGWPVSIDELQRTSVLARRWDAGNEDEPSEVVKGRFAAIYGLYSRNGRLYPPYTPIPDVNWREVLYNLG